jgi:hypothetical protein
MKKFLFAVLISVFVSGLVISFPAQTKKPVKKNVKPEAVVNPTPQASPTPQPSPETPTVNRQAKKNERPGSSNQANQTAVQNKTTAPNYFYEFTRPGFTVSKIHIEHDESGKGTISFVKSISDEVITDPIEVSPAALERIQNALAALDFFNSSESYQYEKDYSHLGNITIKIQKDGRARETKFNWTQNPDARALADEYRRISNQYIWMFDINLSRENQPLESPKLMDLIDGYIRRNEISDAAQLIPFLKELGNDERIPLIARNHATRLIKQIEKEKK